MRAFRESPVVVANLGRSDWGSASRLARQRDGTIIYFSNKKQLLYPERIIVFSASSEIRTLAATPSRGLGIRAQHPDSIHNAMV
jgi:hypothetical protein